MKPPKLRMLMLTLIAAGPLASTPALASGNQGSFWSNWNQILQWINSNYGTSGGSSGTGTSLPGPGALGLVVIGLGTGIIVARRKKKQ